MGAFSACAKMCAILVALVAVGIGALFSGLLRQTGFFSFLDKLEPGGEAMFKGMAPAMHDGVPWAFTLDQMHDASGEVIIVTGANVGLGYWTAYHLAAKNAKVVIACRSESKCADAAESIKAGTGATVETGNLDLASFASIRKFAAEVSKNHKTINSLVLNAGIMMCPFQTTKEGLEMQIGTNHFGHHLLTKLLLPQLEAGAASDGVATISVVTSNTHYNSYPEGIRSSIDAMNDKSTYEAAAAYGQSKLANVLFAQELAGRVKDKNILVNSAHPGTVDTELARHFKSFLKGIVGDWLTETLMEGLLKPVVWDPKDAALTQLYLAVGSSLRQQKITGKYYHPIARETKPDVHASNQTLQKHLWTLTEKFIASH